MGANSKISWTHHTFNPWRGCSKVHEGCANCYAERESHRFPVNRGIWGPNGTRVMASADMWAQPIKWNKQAQKKGVRYRVFCASLADVFEPWDGRIRDHNDRELWVNTTGDKTIVADDESKDFAYLKTPLTMDMLRVKLFALIDATPNLNWLLVTKRPENIRQMWSPWPLKNDTYRPNVWLLTSVSKQPHYDVQWPQLEKCRDLCAVLGISAEPLLGQIELGKPKYNPHGFGQDWQKPLLPDWVIVGGESGSKAKARVMELAWVRYLRDQCSQNGIPFHLKQWGEYRPMLPDMRMEWVGKDAAGRTLDGREWDEFPKGAVT